jgi:hypothetical protein
LTLAFVAILAFATSASAQSSSQPRLDVPKLMNAGKSVSIGYTNPAMAGQTVIIEVDNGMRRETQTAVIEIHLDAKGRGSATWTVPQWFGANFNAPEAAEQHATIV